MKIAYFITGLGLGGAETVTVGVAGQMARRGHQVVIVSLTGERALAVDPAVRVVELRMPKTPGGMLSALRRARRVVREFHPDVVHGNMVHANIFARVLRLFTRIPRLVCTEHSKDIRGRGRMLAYRATDFLSDVNTNVSREAADHFIVRRAFGRGKSFAVYNGIDTARFSPAADKREEVRRRWGIGGGEFLWINVGRLTEAKDQAGLIDAFERAGVGKLLIVGDGELRERLEARAGDGVVFAGARSDVDELYNAADCFVLSSAWEGFGIVLAEAMACGLPVIATDAGGCAEVVDDPRWMVPVRDPQALADKMSCMSSLSVQRRKALGAANRQKAMRFDIGAICDVWEHLYTNGINAINK